MGSRSKWEEMVKEYVGTHGTATYTKTRPDTRKVVETGGPKDISADKGSTIDIIREKNRKTFEEADKE